MIISLNNELIAILVPSSAKNFKVDYSPINNALQFELSWGDDCLFPNGSVPVDKCKIVGTINSLFEFDFNCDNYVSMCPGYGYRDYSVEEYNGGSSPFDVWLSFHLKTPNESFFSLLKSAGVLSHDLTGKKILILEKVI